MKNKKKDIYQILENSRNEHKVTCSCGTKTVLYNVDKKICRGCHKFVFKNKKIEFEYRLKESLKR